MIPEVEITKRIEEGEYVDPKTFDLKIFSKKVKELIKEYEIKYNPHEIIPNDNVLIKDVYEAALHLALDVGVLCVSSNRRFFISEDELKEVMKAYNESIIIGEGKDSKVLYHRKVQDSRYPIVIGGFAGTPTPLYMYLDSAISYAQEMLVDAIDHGSINEVYGVKVISRTPLEVFATRIEVKMVKEALRRVGREGLHIIGGESSVTSVGALSVMNSDYLRKTDGLLVAILNEMKVDYDNLTKALAFNSYGGHVVALIDPLLGGFAGGPEGTAICALAEVLISSVVYKPSYFLIHPTHIIMLSTSVPECMWVQSIVGQAIAKYTPFIAVGNVWPANGGGTDYVIYETLANTITNTISGLHLLGVTTTSGKYPNSTGLEARIMAYMARHVTDKKWTLNQANEVVQELIKYYKDTLRRPTLGKPFDQLYDMTTLKPKSVLKEVYKNALNKVHKELGIDLAIGEILK